jgi:hypothetical protein
MKGSIPSTIWFPFQPILDLNASDALIARAVMLPLDYSRKQLNHMLTLSGESERLFRKRLDEYIVEALKSTGDPDDAPDGRFSFHTVGRNLLGFIGSEPS